MAVRGDFGYRTDSLQRKVTSDVLNNPLDERRAPDVMGHLKKLVKVSIPALVVAVVAGLVVLFVLAQLKPTYQATVTAQIDAQTPVVSGDAYLYQMTAPYLALAGSQAVRQATADQMGNGWDAERVGKDVTVQVSKSPLLLEISGRAADRAEALKAATTTVQALDTAARTQRAQELRRAAAGPTGEMAAVQQQLRKIDAAFTQGGPVDPTSNGDPRRADLVTRTQELTDQITRINEGGINGLSVLSAPDVSSVVESAPVPKSIAGFLALITFILTAELLAFSRGRFGRRLSALGAERISHANNMSFETTEVASTGFPPVTAGMIARRASRKQKTMVIVTDLAEDTVATWLPEERHPELLQFEPISSNWAGRLDDSIGLAIVVAWEGENSREKLERTAKTLAGLGVPARMVMVSTTKATPAADIPAAETEPAVNAERVDVDS
jgi:hypothetical protein